MIINMEDAQRLEHAILDRLGVDPNHVERGSISVESESGMDTVVITWAGTATMPADEFRDLFNDLGVRGAS